MTIKRIRIVIMLWLLLILGSVTAFSANYRKVFGSDWNAAEQFVKEHHEAWKQEFDLFGVDSRIAEAVIFPELIRYSMWQDEIEKVAVNGLYILKGTEGANFSIGCFQMKPSFAEKIETALNRSSLSKAYGFVFNLQPNVEARRSRVRRLSSMQGQCRYLAIFIRLLQLRYPQLAHLSGKEQVRYLATAYNTSFSASWQSLEQFSHEHYFHTDIIKTRFTHTYCYADIAVYFYLTN